MSKNFGKCFGPSTRDLSSRPRCPSFSLSKFASQLKSIQSLVQVGILGICVTSSIFRVLLSEFWTSGLKIQSPRDLVPGSWVSGSQFQSPGCQGLVSQGPKVPGPRFAGPGFRVSGSQGLESRCPRVSGLRVPGLMVPGSRVSGSQDPRVLRVTGPQFQVLILDYALHQFTNRQVLKTILRKEKFLIYFRGNI